MNDLDPEAIKEDWQALLRRPGMNVLATFLAEQINHSRSQLESPAVAGTYDKVCELRGEMQGIRRVIKFVKKEYDRAAKGDTPDKEK